jgi:steroid delta-isomerase-like uncharacterized protein
MRTTVVGLVGLGMLVGVAGALGCGGAEPAPPPLVASPMPPPPVPTAQPPVAEPPAPPKPVMAEAQKKFLTAFEAALAAKSAEKVAALYSTGAVVSSAGKEGVHEAVGRAEIQATRARGFAVMSKAMPDVAWVHTRAIQDDDILVLEWIGTGTDTGGFLDDKPTGKKIGWRGITVLKFDDDGLVKRETTVLDPMTILGQLGRGEAKGKVRPPAKPPARPTQWLTHKDTETEKKNVETVKSLYSLLDKQDDKDAVAMLTDDVVHADLTRPDDAKGKEAAKKDLTTSFKAFPDRKIAIKHAWAAGEVVVAQIEATGTFKGPLGALKPNGKSATTHGIDVLEMKDGKIARITSYANEREFLSQYDLLPKPAPAPPAKK